MNLNFWPAVLAALIFAGPASQAAPAVSRSQPGWFIDGELLLRACSDPNPALCESYMMGVIDAVISNRGIFEGNQICLPTTGATKAAYRAAVVKYLQDHANLRGAIGASLIVTALTEAYPCKP